MLETMRSRGQRELIECIAETLGSGNALFLVPKEEASIVTRCIIMSFVGALSRHEGIGPRCVILGDSERHSESQN